MTDPKGVLIVPVAFNPSGDVRAFTVDASGYLNTVLSTGLTGGGMGEPEGELFTLLGYNPSGELKALELDANDNLLITLLGGTAWDVIRSDGVDAEWDALADVIKNAILTSNLQVIVRNAAGNVVALGPPTTGQVLGESGGDLAWIAPGGAGNYTLIEDKHLAAPAATIDFQNIPQTYKHLELITFLSVSGAVAGTNVPTTFNNDTGNNYDWFREAFRVGADVKTETIGGAYMGSIPTTGSAAVAGSIAGCKAFIPDYTDTSNHKSFTSIGHVKQVNSSGNVFLWNGAGWWRSASAINRITLTSPSGNFIAGCRASLYGLD